MERKKASDFPPEVLKLFDGYVHGFISRRDFLEVGSLGTLGLGLDRFFRLQSAGAATPDGSPDD